MAYKKKSAGKPAKRSAKAEINKKIEAEGNVKDVGLPRALAGMVLYGSEEFSFWVPDAYKKTYPDDRSQWPVFKVRNYNSDDEAVIVSVLLEKGMTEKETLKYFLTDPDNTKLLVKRCLKDVKNLKDGNGTVVKLELVDDEVPDSFLKRVPFKLLSELQRAIMNSSAPSAEDTSGLEF